MFQQIISFEELFGHIKGRRLPLRRHPHLYWPRYQGGLKRRGTFMEYSKNIVDYINAWHSKQKSLQVTEFTRSVNSVHFYDSIVVVERKPRQAPYSEKTGTPSLPVTIQKPSAYKKLKTWFRARFGITKK